MKEKKNSPKLAVSIMQGGVSVKCQWSVSELSADRWPTDGQQLVDRVSGVYVRCGVDS